MVPDDDTNRDMIFLGAVVKANDLRSHPILVFVYTPTPLEHFKVDDIPDYVCYVSVKDFIEKYASDWLVESFRRQHFEPDFEDPKVRFNMF